MQQLRFVAVHEDGEHLVLSDPEDSSQEFLVPVDERLRAAVRHRATPAGRSPGSPISPRQVQAMIRAGQRTDEVAATTGWELDRIARFEGPIVAEREHVSRMAQGAQVRGRGTDGGVPTLGGRVSERLKARGVEQEDVSWDATRPEGGQWTVVVSFVAANRHRQAAWRFEPATRTVEALDDEARWLSEDEQALPGGREAVLGGDGSGAVDLMTTMRERSRARGRRSRRSTAGGRGQEAPGEQTPEEQAPGDRASDQQGMHHPPPGSGSADPAALPVGGHTEDVLPLEDLDYDPATMGLPPAAGRPEGTEEVPADDVPAKEARAEDVPVVNEAAAGDDDLVEPPETTSRHLGRRGRRGHRGQPEEATLADFFGPDDDELVEDELAEDELVGDYDAVPDGRVSEEVLDEEEVLTVEDLAGTADGEDDQQPGDHGPHVVDLPEDDDVEAAEPEAEEPPTAELPTAEREHAGPPGEGQAETREAQAEAAETDETDETDETPKKKGRTSVPSWDDIMFGARDRR